MKHGKRGCNFRNPKSTPLHQRPSGGVEIQLQKLHPKHTQRNYATRLEHYYNSKFGQIVTPIAVLKTLAVISSTFQHNVKLWVLNVAPSRHLKTQTTQEQTRVFPSKRSVYVGSDFTIHGLIREYESGRKLNNKCLLINDMTLLLASKAGRTRSRLIDAFSELASEGRYIYSDFQQTHTVEARFSLIANITPHSFLVNKKDLLDNTFTERCLVVFHSLTDEEMSNANLTREARTRMQIERFSGNIREGDVKVTREDLVRFDEYAKRWRILGGYSSSSSLFDMIKSIAIAYAILSGHTELTKEEYRFLDLLEPHLRNPEENAKLDVLELASKGRSQRDICLIMNKDYTKYRPFVSRTIADYRRKGILL